MKTLKIEVFLTSKAKPKAVARGLEQLAAILCKSPDKLAKQGTMLTPDANHPVITWQVVDEGEVAE